MKKLALAVVLFTAISVARAQEGNNICVFNSLQTFGEGGSRDDLERATKCSDEAIANENTMNKSKTWYYRGQLYTTLCRDSVLRKRHPEAPLEAIKAFKKLYDLADPKFKDWDDAFSQHILVLSLVTFNAGVDQYQARNYSQAYQYFYALKDLYAVYVGRKKESNIDINRALKFAGISAENAGDKAAALKAYKDWLDITGSAAAYQKYGVSLKASGDTVGAKKVIDDGLAKYPKDAALLVEKINFYLEAGKYTDALTFVNNLLDVEPKNDGALFIKALAYDKLGNQDSVVYYYHKAIEVNPKATNSYINLAAVYVNKAKDINIEMNKLGNTAADIKKYDEMKGQVKALYVQAKPFLEKAKELDPADAQVGRTLTQINSFLESNNK